MMASRGAAAGSTGSPVRESLMFLRSAFGVAAVAVIAAMAIASPSSAQTSPSTETKPAATTPTAPQNTSAPTDAFGEDITLTAKPIVFVKGTGTWDKAFETISGSFKKVRTYIDKEGLKVDGLPMAIFTAMDDTGFDYQAAIPIAEPPKNPPHGDIAAGQSPEGHALKFVHRGSYDSLEDTYEAITNYMDEKRLDSKDMIIEEYVTDPVSADQKNLVINVLVMVK
jgi:effector-binding domain-containing protein